MRRAESSDDGSGGDVSGDDGGGGDGSGSERLNWERK